MANPSKSSTSSSTMVTAKILAMRLFKPKTCSSSKMFATYGNGTTKSILGVKPMFHPTATVTSKKLSKI